MLLRHNLPGPLRLLHEGHGLAHLHPSLWLQVYVRHGRCGYDTGEDELSSTTD